MISSTIGNMLMTRNPVINAAARESESARTHRRPEC